VTGWPIHDISLARCEANISVMNIQNFHHGLSSNPKAEAQKSENQDCSAKAKALLQISHEVLPKF